MTHTTRCAIASLLCLLYACQPSAEDAQDPAPTPKATPSDPRHTPEVVLWAWSRPEDLRALPPDVGVAFLASTFVLSGDHVLERPRVHPLRSRDGAWLEAVVRIEPNAHTPPTMTEASRRHLVERLVALRALHDTPALQLDYDAPLSQRDFYLALTRDLRAALPPDVRLSMTALASWCMFDDWIADAAVDEVVPMLYSMGPEGPAIWQRVREHQGRLLSPRCHGAVGVNVDSPPPSPNPLTPGPRYVFSDRRWTPERWAPFVTE